MGSDRKKDKDEKKKSSSSRKDKSRKRHRRESDDEQVEEEDHHHKSKGISRRDKDKDKEKERKDKHRSKRRKDDNLKGNFQELSNDDYFSKNNEFATWLKEERSVFFSDLSSESARKLFGDFVEEWNNQKLESRYYEGIASGPRSAHNWAFKK